MYAASKCCDCTHNIKVIALTFHTPLYELSFVLLSYCPYRSVQAGVI